MAATTACFVPSAMPATQGECTGSPRDCSGQDGQCSTGVCNEAANVCEAQDANEGSGCNDGQFCTIGDACSNGMCVGTTPRDCSALNSVCGTGVCNESANACQVQPANEGGGCDDGQFCTVGDVCDNGTCSGPTLRDCSLLDGTCTNGVCNEAADACQAQPINNGGTCNDGLFCTVGDVCNNGMCAGPTPRDCSSLAGACTAGVCNEASDACQAAPANNGGTCDDGLFCTVGDVCGNGMCAGPTPRDCSAQSDRVYDGRLQRGRQRLPGAGRERGRDLRGGRQPVHAGRLSDGRLHPSQPGAGRRVQRRPVLHRHRSVQRDGHVRRRRRSVRRWRGVQCHVQRGRQQLLRGDHGAVHRRRERLHERPLQRHGRLRAPGEHGPVRRRALLQRRRRVQRRRLHPRGRSLRHRAECANTCNETADDCITPADTPCKDDDLACTSDLCQGGVCAHAPVDALCDQGECVLGVCSPASPNADKRGCITSPVGEGEQCTDDGFSCTDDTCNAGACLHVPIASRCVPPDDCTSAVCEPGQPTADTAGCIPGPVLGEGQECAEDGEPCTNDLCRTGACAHDDVPDTVTCEPVTRAFRQALALEGLSRRLMATVGEAFTPNASGPAVVTQSNMVAHLTPVTASLEEISRLLSGKAAVPPDDGRIRGVPKTLAQLRADAAIVELRRKPSEVRAFLRLTGTAKRKRQVPRESARTLKSEGRLVLERMKKLGKELRRLRRVSQTFVP
jgi:hypothetical protein